MYHALMYRRVIIVALILCFGLPLAQFIAPTQPRIAEAAVHSYTANPNVAISDAPFSTCGTTAGTPVTSTITVLDNYSLVDVNVLLNITHTWVGDLMITLSHGATTVTLVDRPGLPVPDSCSGANADNIITLLDDESGGGSVENGNPPTGASYTPQQALSAFDGENVGGNWTLTVVDWNDGDTGTLVSWGLDIDDGNPIGATAVCNLDNLNVTITAGDTPFNVTGTGPGLPLNNVTTGTFPLVGPGNWTGVTVTEVGGNGQSTNLGNFNCATTAVSASAACNLDNLNVTITTGDTPFNVTGTGPGLPLNNVTSGTFPLVGPGSWTGLTVTEVGGNGQSTNLGNFNCATNGLNTTAQCIGSELWINIVNGDAPFNVTGTGPGLPLSNVATSTFWLPGAGTWTNVVVTEVGGNQQAFTIGTFSCGGGIPVPNRGLIKIDTGQAQFALQSPNGAPLTLTNGTPILLPADADHNGYDTYNVTGVVLVDGEYWLSIFLGNTTWGWVPLDLVTPLTQLTLPEASSSSPK